MDTFDLLHGRPDLPVSCDGKLVVIEDVTRLNFGGTDSKQFSSTEWIVSCRLVGTPASSKIWDDDPVTCYSHDDAVNFIARDAKTRAERKLPPRSYRVCEVDTNVHWVNVAECTVIDSRRANRPEKD